MNGRTTTDLERFHAEGTLGRTDDGRYRLGDGDD